jgi:hypothetical protein
MEVEVRGKSLVRCPRGSFDFPMACIRGHSVSNGARCWSGDTSTSSTAFADRTDETSFSLLPMLPRPLFSWVRVGR